MKLIKYADFYIISGIIINSISPIEYFLRVTCLGEFCEFACINDIDGKNKIRIRKNNFLIQFVLISFRNKGMRRCIG